METKYLTQPLPARRRRINELKELILSELNRVRNVAGDDRTEAPQRTQRMQAVIAVASDSLNEIEALADTMAKQIEEYEPPH